MDLVCLLLALIARKDLSKEAGDSAALKVCTMSAFDGTVAHHTFRLQAVSAADKITCDCSWLGAIQQPESPDRRRGRAPT